MSNAPPKLVGRDYNELASSAPVGTSWRTSHHGSWPGDLYVTNTTVTGLPFQWGGFYRLPTVIDDVAATADERRAHLDYWEEQARGIAAKVSELRASGFVDGSGS